MRTKQFRVRFLVAVAAVSIAGIAALFAVSPLLHARKIINELSEGLTHLRSLGNEARVSSDKAKSNGIGVLTTTWTNVFNDRSTVDLERLKLLVSEIEKQDANPKDLGYETLCLWLDAIITIQPKSKSYVDNLAKPNLADSFNLAHSNL